jgi:hypothetical protein
MESAALHAGGYPVHAKCRFSSKALLRQPGGFEGGGSSKGRLPSLTGVYEAPGNADVSATSWIATSGRSDTNSSSPEANSSRCGSAK